MRFAKTTKRSVSSVTVRGWSGKSHHAKRSETPIDFVGVDGEGVTGLDGIHRYVLFGVGQDQIENPNGLNWREVFEFLYEAYKPRTAFVGFFLGYDFTQLFRTLPENRARMLLTSEGKAARKHRIPNKAPHPVECDGWQFDILGMKRLRIRPKGCHCENATCDCRHAPWMYVCDVGPFFQASFLTVINPEGWADGTAVVNDVEFAHIKRGKEKRSTAILDDEMRSYNRLENLVLARVMHGLDVGFHGIGIHLPPSKWFGPGQAAQTWLRNEKVPTREDLESIVPVWFNEAARMSYYGGWFEQFIHGVIPGESHEYDINSAYPSIIARLPCLMHGTYSRGNGMPNARSSDLCLVYARLWSPGMPDSPRSQHIGSMLHRDGNGRILRPNATEGWFWWSEVQAAEKAKIVKRLDNKGKQQILRWVKYEPCDCLPPMRNVLGLYQKRLDVGKTSPLGKAAKLVYNSDYGKFAQSIGEPIFGNPVYASYITAGCRTQILDAIATHPEGIADVSMVATDAVYFITPHPGLRISDALGEWDYKRRLNLTLFKPGVYWDDSSRERISQGRSPHFKARGFAAADFANSITRVDSRYAAWESTPATSVGNGDDWWPSVDFTPAFSMTTALQALRQNDWTRAGVVTDSAQLTQNADPHSKRTGLYRDTYDGRTIYRSRPHDCMDVVHGEPQWIPTHPYEKRFGMEDPWSDEYKGSLGILEDGLTTDVLSWILKGE